MVALRLADIELYDANGTPLRASDVAIFMSSTSGGGGGANCNDQQLGTVCSTAGPGDGDAQPTLHALYHCPNGATSLSQVVVRSQQENLTTFVLEFVGRGGVVDRPAYRFSQSRSEYYISATGKLAGMH